MGEGRYMIISHVESYGDQGHYYKNYNEYFYEYDAPFDKPLDYWIDAVKYCNNKLWSICSND